MFPMDRAPVPCEIECDSRGRRVRKWFADSYAARRFYAAKDKAGKRPKVCKPERTLFDTPRMEERAVRALRLTWDVIGSDCLASAEGGVMTREEVIDGVSACGFVGGYPETYGYDKEAVAWLEAQPPEEQDRILRAAFPHARYGM